MNSTVLAALIAGGSTAVVGVTGFWASVRNTRKTIELTRNLTEQGQVTDRYTKAIEQLGSKEMDVRVGSIYALERVARDSAPDHPTVMEVLAAFIREHSREQWPRPLTHEPGADPPGRRLRPDVQAAITVIGHRNPKRDQRDIDLREAFLVGASLHGMDFAHAIFSHAILTRANLLGANLYDAVLLGADLHGAVLLGANLTNANLTKADLTDAIILGADLTDADLTDANLTGVALTSADLARDLWMAAVEPAAFPQTARTKAAVNAVDAGINLTRAKWPAGVVVPADWQLDPDSGRLKRAPTEVVSAPTGQASGG